MTPPGIACLDAGAHAWSEWRYDESAAGAVRDCARCSATISRAGTVLVQPTLPAAATHVAEDTSAASRVFHALGGSPFIEELRGSIRDAARCADDFLAGGVTETARTDALIVRAAVHLMAGEVLMARPLLLDALARSAGDADRRLRALSHLLDAMHQQYNIFPDRSGSGAVEITARWSGATALLPLDTQWNEAMRGSTDETAQLEAWLVYAFGSQLLPSRYMLDARRYAPSDQTLVSMLSMTTASSDRLRTIATSISRPAFAAYADWIDADMHRRAGDLDMAHTLLDRARSAYAAAGDDVGTALCLMTDADWRCAPFSTPLHWNFAVTDSSGPSSSLSVTLEAAEGQPGTAVSYDEAERLFRTAGATRGEAAIAIRRGYAAAMRDDWSEAIAQATRARDLFASAGDSRNAQLANTHLLMAEASSPASGIDAIARATSIGRWGTESGSFSFTLGLGILINRLARHWLVRRGDAERALAGSAAARALFEALGAGINAAQCLVDAGLMHKAVGERRVAVTLLEQALDRYAALEAAHPSVALTLKQRMVLLAVDVYQLALQDTDADAMERSAARLSTQLPRLPTVQNLQQSMEAMQRRMNALMQGDDTDADGTIEIDDMLTLVPLGRMAESIVQHAAVLAPVYRARVARNAGDAMAAAALLDTAEAAVDRATTGEREMLRAAVLAERRDYAGAAAAMRLYVEAGGANAGLGGEITTLMQSAGGTQADAEVALQDRRTHEQAFAAFVMVHAWDDAARHLAALERIAGTEWWQADAKPWQPLCDMAELHENRDDLPRARQCYDRAVEQLEQRRAFLSRDELKVALASDKGAQYLYFLAARAAVQAGDAAAGLMYAERGKSRALLDLMASARGTTAATETRELRHWRERSMELAVTHGLLGQARTERTPDAARITTLEAQVAEREAALHTAELALSAVNPRFRELVSPTASLLRADEVQQALPDNGLLLEYFVLGEDLLAWAVPRSGAVVAHHATVDVAALARDVQALHVACDQGFPWRALADALAATLLTPFAAQIRTAASILIVPHGALHLLPFHLLPADDDVLAAAHNLSYLPSASTLQLLEPHDATPMLDRILVVGNPTGDLPSARAEAEFVAAQFPDAVLLLEDAATEPAVRAQLPGMPLVHFATHGTLDARSPLNSSVALADDECLTVYELMSLRLDARLVVLSACSTGQGESTGGDDLLGLTRGLLAAGARAALVTLWPVDDHATALFMQEFYARLRGGLSPRAALQRAQHHVRFMSADEIAARTRGAHRRVRRAAVHDPAPTTSPVIAGGEPPHGAVPDEATGYGHPYYWAPFVLVGR